VAHDAFPESVAEYLEVCPIRFGLVLREERFPMNWNSSVRQTHRWVSIAFTVAVIVAFIALGQEKPVVWASYLPLLPLAFLLLTGLYLFVLPHAAKWSSGRRASTRVS
jgi:hypothetical protein